MKILQTFSAAHNDADNVQIVLGFQSGILRVPNKSSIQYVVIATLESQIGFALHETDDLHACL